MTAWAKPVATVAYVGLMRPAPGTWGSLAALPLAWVLYQIGGAVLFAAMIIVAYVIGIKATALYTAGKADHDPSEVVIDEVVGQWIALLPVVFGATMMGAEITRLWPGWIAAFVLFRLFDIWKPGPVGTADKRGDATGVMLDDVIAGVFAAITSSALAAFSHLVLM